MSALATVPPMGWVMVRCCMALRWVARLVAPDGAPLIVRVGAAVGATAGDA
eukprot:gene24047-31702_t